MWWANPSSSQLHFTELSEPLLEASGKPGGLCLSNTKLHMQTDLWKMTCKLATAGICVVNMCVLNSGAILSYFN